MYFCVTSRSMFFQFICFKRCKSVVTHFTGDLESRFARVANPGFLSWIQAPKQMETKVRKGRSENCWITTPPTDWISTPLLYILLSVSVSCMFVGFIIFPHQNSCNCIFFYRSKQKYPACRILKCTAHYEYELICHWF